MATLPSVDQEREIVERVLASLELPMQVKAPIVEFREDHSGDESVYITFPVRVNKSMPLTPKRMKLISAFLRQVDELLVEAHLQRFPYTALSETR